MDGRSGGWSGVEVRGANTKGRKGGGAGVRGDAGLDSRPFSMPLTAASPTVLFTDSMVSLTAEVESFCANGLVEKRMRVVVAMGARGARIAIVLRRDMSFAGFWSVCFCCLDRWGCNSSSCLRC